MKKIHLAAILAAIIPTSLHAQTSFLLNGTSGTNSFTNNYTVSAGLSQINLSLGFYADYLVLGGGGGGGGATSTLRGAGGGGAGGLLLGSTQLASSNYSVVVGAGGAGGANNSTNSLRQGQSGSNSVFGSLTAVGGGGGGGGGDNSQFAGTSGGSGGGAGGGGNSGMAGASGGTGTTGQGASGGASVNNTGSNPNGSSNNRWAGGGGGGAGSAGTSGDQAPSNSGFAEGGDGGSGASSAITGSSVTYAGGGGGGAVGTGTLGSPSNIAGTGGAGGGGNGGAGNSGSSGVNGVSGRGGGGGGAASSGTGGNGGSGAVIVRYQGASLGNIGGTVTAGTGSAAGYTIHTFTNNGSANFDMSGVNLNNRLGATISGNVTAARVDYNGPGTLTLAGSSNSAFSGGLYANTGTVRLTGTMETRNLFIANPSNSTASVVVDGGVLRGSSLSGPSISRIEVGQRGNGSLTLESGSITSDRSFVGYSPGSFGGVTNGSGTVTVNGGTWTSSSVIQLGDSGSGTLNVNGGTVNAQALTVGLLSNGNGLVNVTGGTLGINNRLSLSQFGGAATLNISNGGTVVAGGGLYLFSTNAALNLEAGGTLQILNGAKLSTVDPAGFDINGNLVFTGPSAIDGPLRIGSGGTNGSLSGNLSTTSSVTFNRSDDLTYSGNIGGRATLIKEGAGTLTLSGSNNFSGDTLVNNGRLLLGSSTALGNAAVVKVNTNGTIEAGQRVVVGYLDVNGGTVVGSNNLVSALTLVNSGQVAGLADGVDFAAGILKRTAGVATVDGANTFTGAIRVEAGTLQMTNGGSFAAASFLLLSNAATVDLNDISQQFSSVNGAGSLALGSGTLTVGGSDSSDFSGAISGTGAVVKSGSGTMTLSGTSTYSGATTVSGGELVVDGAANSSTVTVSSGGILSGSGSVGGIVVNLGGTIRPGNSPGTQPVVGNVVWNAGGNYDWEIYDAAPGGAGTSWDLISASGTLDLSALTVGSEFNINLWSLQSVGPDVNGEAINFNPNQSYTWTILTAAGGITGYTGTDQFIVNTGAFNGTGGFANDLAGGTFSVLQDGNNLNLRFTAAGGEAIPEPGTWAAAALLAGGAAFMRWRRRK